MGDEWMKREMKRERRGTDKMKKERNHLKRKKQDNPHK